MEKLRRVSKTTARKFAKAILGVNAEMSEDDTSFYFKTGLLRVEVFKIIFVENKFPYAHLIVDIECKDAFNFVNGEALRVEDNEADE